MRLISDYYPYILYSIPYLVAAYVLIRAKVKSVRAAREEAAAEASHLAEAEAERVAGERPANMDYGPGGRRITAMLRRVKTRRVA